MSGELRAESTLFGQVSKRLLETQQTDNEGKTIPMTLGWHVGEIHGSVYYFKEGGVADFIARCAFTRLKALPRW